MRLPRFSIASILAVIAIFAIALAALRSPSYLWANVTFSLALGAIVVGVVNVIYGRDAARAYWVGFSLCGGIYLAICSLPDLRDSVCPRLVTEVLLDVVYPHMSPALASSSGVTYGTSNISVVPGQPMLGNISLTSNSGPLRFITPPRSPWADWTEPDRTVGVGYQIGTVSLRSSVAFRQIGHSVFTLLVAVLGGTLARYRYRDSGGEKSGLASAPSTGHFNGCSS